MNRNSAHENEARDADFNEIDNASQTHLRVADNEEAKSPSHQSGHDSRQAMYISLSSIQTEAAMRHMPKQFILVEKNKLK